MAEAESRMEAHIAQSESKLEAQLRQLSQQLQELLKGAGRNQDRDSMGDQEAIIAI